MHIISIPAYVDELFGCALVFHNRFISFEGSARRELPGGHSSLSEGSVPLTSDSR